MAVACALFPLGIIGFTDGVRVLAYHRDLHELSLEPGEYRIENCGATTGAHREWSDRADCIRVMPHAGGEPQPQITYYRHEPNFSRLSVLADARTPLTVWYAESTQTILFTRFGTLRAARAGSEYRVDAVNTLLYRRRVAARSVTVGLAVLFVLIPGVVRRPVREYLRGSG